MTMTGEHFSMNTLYISFKNVIDIIVKEKVLLKNFKNYDWLKVFDFVHRSKKGDQYAFRTFCHIPVKDEDGKMNV